MAILKNVFYIIILLFFTVSCSVMSRQIREQSLQSVSFSTLLHNINEYSGNMVILGGYILATENKVDKTMIQVIQAPLTFRDYPDLKDKSEGRFVVVHKGFLDPEIYQKDRRITVAGILVGGQVEDIGQCPYECLKLESREIYLWPEYDESDYWLYDDPYYFYRGYPYDRHFNHEYPYYRGRLPYYRKSYRRYPYYRNRSPYYPNPYWKSPYY